MVALELPNDDDSLWGEDRGNDVTLAIGRKSKLLLFLPPPTNFVTRSVSQFATRFISLGPWLSAKARVQTTKIRGPGPKGCDRGAENSLGSKVGLGSNH